MAGFSDSTPVANPTGRRPNVFDQFDPQPDQPKRANVFDQFDAPQPAKGGMFDDLIPQKPAQPSGGMFDDLIPTQPQQAATPPAQPHFNPRGAPDASTPSADQAEKLAYAKDFGRELAQDALFNYGDEAIAGVRSVLGEDYAKALEDEREQLKGAESRLGAGSKAAALGISMMMPMGPVAKLVQRMAGTGAGVVRTAAASMIPMAGVGGVSAIGAMDDKSDPAADAQAALVGAGETALTAGMLNTVGVPIARAGKTIVSGIGDLASRPIEWAHYRNQNPAPLAATTNFAVKKLADAATLGGMRTPQDVQAALAKNAVLHTPSALVNMRNDRLTAEALQSAADLQNPNVARIENGQQRNDNVFTALQDAQATNANGQTQGDAFRGRLFASNDVPAADRSLPAVQQQNTAQLEYNGGRLEALNAPAAGATFDTAHVPGFMNAAEDPDFTREYRNAARAISKPGSADSIPANEIPLLPGDYDAALDAHTNNGGVGPAPVALTDGNIPIQVLSLMRRNMSAASAAEKDPAAQENARRLWALYDHLTSGRTSTPSANVRTLNQINQEMHGLHNDAEDVAAGYAIPGQTGPTRANSIVNAQLLPADRQDNVALGMVHHVADASKANNENLGSLADGLFANPDFRDAYDQFMTGRSPYAVPAEATRAELNNIGDMQGVSSLLSSTSQNRRLDPSSLPAEALNFYIKSKVIPSVEHARAARYLLNGRTQARTAEIARLATDTSGEGLRLLTEELAKRSAARNSPPPLGRIMIVNEIARQLAGMKQQQSTDRQ